MIRCSFVAALTVILDLFPFPVPKLESVIPIPGASGLALTNDSSGLADMRVWLDEKRHRGPAWSGRSRAAGSRDRIGEQPAKTCVAGADCAAERRWDRHDGDPAADRQRQADDLALAGALYGRRGRWVAPRGVPAASPFRRAPRAQMHP